MARSLTSDMQIEVVKGFVQPVCFIKMSFADGDLNMWTGYGPFEFNGEEYVGTGNVLGIDKVEEAADLRAIGINFTISGVPPELRSIALNASSNIQGGAVTMWWGLLWGEVIPELVHEPYQIFKGRMDIMVIKDTGAECTIQLSAESVLIDLERPRKRLYTPEDQAIEYSGDTFFNFVVSLQDKSIEWGRT